MSLPVDERPVWLYMTAVANLTIRENKLFLRVSRCTMAIPKANTTDFESLISEPKNNNNVGTPNVENVTGKDARETRISFRITELTKTPITKKCDASTLCLPST